MTNRQKMAAKRRLEAHKRSARHNLKRVDNIIQANNRDRIPAIVPFCDITEDFNKGYLPINKRLMHSIKSAQLKEHLVRLVCLRLARNIDF